MSPGRLPPPFCSFLLLKQKTKEPALNIERVLKLGKRKFSKKKFIFLLKKNNRSSVLEMRGTRGCGPHGALPASMVTPSPGPSTSGIGLLYMYYAYTLYYTIYYTSHWLWNRSSIYYYEIGRVYGKGER
jgi:hypothetical protein